MTEARLAAGRTLLAFVRELTRWIVFALALGAAHAQEPGDDEPITIVGRFLLPDGEPAVGASVKVHGWGANQDRKMKYGIPPNYKDPAPVETGEDGRFEVSFVPPRAFQFVVDANLEGYVEAGWRWSELEPGTKKDLGETTFEPAGVLEGSILDSEGNTLIGTWRVTAEVRGRRRVDGRETPRAYASPHKETGIFRLEGLPAGEVFVDARDRGHARIKEQTFVVVPGKVRRIVLEYEGPSLANQINVTVFSRPFYIFEPAEESIRLKLPSGDVKKAHHVAGSSQTYRFDDVDPGEYEVEILDPLFDVWRQTGVKNGDNIDARLEGNAGVRLSIVDPDGKPVKEYGLRIEFHRSNSWPREFELAKAGTEHESVAYFGGLLPTPFILVARVEGWPALEIEVEDLASNETREITATLSRGTSIAGRVVDSGGAPLEGVVVEYTKGERPGHSLGPGSSITTSEGPVPPKKGDTPTDADGRFVLPGLAPGPWTLRARFSDWLATDRTLEAGSDEEIVLTAPPSGWLAGRVELPEGATLEPLDVSVHSDAVPANMHFLGMGGEPKIAEDATFRLGPLPAGDVRLDLVFKTSDGDSFGLTSWTTSSIEQGHYEIVDGQTTDVVVDLRETYPGTLRARVRIDGAVVRGAQVGTVAPPDGPKRSGVSSRRVDADGVAHCGGLSAGDWIVTVWPKDRSWRWVSPEPVTVPVAGEIEVDLDVHLAERRVRFLDDGTGKPLAERAIVALMGEGWRASRQEATTDAEGFATFVLCDGTVEFRDAKADEMDTTEVEWSVAGEGPGDVRLFVVPD